MYSISYRYASSYISVTVTADGNGTTLPQKTVYAALAAPPLFEVSGPSPLIINSTVGHYISDFLPKQASSYGIYYYDWSVTDKLQFESSHAYQTDVYVKGITLGTGILSFYTTNGCGTTNFSILVRVVSAKSLKIYPNPASNEITIEIDIDEETADVFDENDRMTDEEYLLTIHNNSGILIFNSKHYNPDEIKISTSGWQKGTYYVTLINGNEKYTGSFIIND